MAKTPKVKGPEAVGFKEIFGVTALSINNGFAAIFMSTMLTWMVVIIGLVPAILAFVGIMVIKDYPIDTDMRKDIQQFISTHQAKKKVD